MYVVDTLQILILGIKIRHFSSVPFCPKNPYLPEFSKLLLRKYCIKFWFSQPDMDKTGTYGYILSDTPLPGNALKKI